MFAPLKILKWGPGLGFIHVLQSKVKLVGPKMNKTDFSLFIQCTAMIIGPVLVFQKKIIISFVYKYNYEFYNCRTCHQEAIMNPDCRKTLLYCLYKLSLLFGVTFIMLNLRISITLNSFSYLNSLKFLKNSLIRCQILFPFINNIFLFIITVH